MVSLEQFLASCTVPLIYQYADRTFVQGTGTFFSFGEKKYLVTAAHVLNDIDPKSLAVPEAPTKANSQVWTLGSITVCHPKDEDFDVAVIHLRDEKFLERVSCNWHFLRSSNVSTVPTAEYIVAGYPTATVEKVNGLMMPQKGLLQLFTGPYMGPIEGDCSKFDMFLRYSRQAAGAFGGDIHTPELHGVSGASVWSIGKRSGAIWAPESLLRIAGIQVSFVHSSYVRMKTWDLVLEVLRRADPDAAAAFEQPIGAA